MYRGLPWSPSGQVYDTGTFQAATYPALPSFSFCAVDFIELGVESRLAVVVMVSSFAAWVTARHPTWSAPAHLGHDGLDERGGLEVMYEFLSTNA